jgi:hypothetical protein
VHRMVAHSAFVVVARRLSDKAAEPGITKDFADVTEADGGPDDDPDDAA